MLFENLLWEDGVLRGYPILGAPGSVWCHMVSHPEYSLWPASHLCSSLPPPDDLLGVEATLLLGQFQWWDNPYSGVGCFESQHFQLWLG